MWRTKNPFFIQHFLPIQWKFFLVSHCLSVCLCPFKIEDNSSLKFVRLQCPPSCPPSCPIFFCHLTMSQLLQNHLTMSHLLSNHFPCLHLLHVSPSRSVTCGQPKQQLSYRVKLESCIATYCFYLRYFALQSVSDRSFITLVIF